MPEWPDWEGQAVAIIASGPSVKKEDVRLLEDRIVTFAIKKNIEIAPWAEAVYGCDFPWWRSVNGLPDYQGLKLCYDGKGAQYGCLKVDIETPTTDRMLFDRRGLIGGGGSSGFQAMNLAVQFGATHLLLLGFDCQDRSGVHWYGRNSWAQAGNPQLSNFRRWIAAFAQAASQLRDRGVQVVNASPISDVKAFRKMSVAETLEAWGL